MVFRILVQIINTLYSSSSWSEEQHFRGAYNRASFCNGLFYDISLLRPLSSQTKHSRLLVHHCCNSSILSLLSALLALTMCMCFFLIYFSAVVLRWLWFYHAMTSIKKNRKEEKIQTVDVTFILDFFWTTTWAFLNKIKSDLIDFFFSVICVIFYKSNSVN